MSARLLDRPSAEPRVAAAGALEREATDAFAGPGGPEREGAPDAGPSAPAVLLPPELPWLYVVFPLPAAYLMGYDLLSKPWPVFLRVVAKMYLPFGAFGLVFYILYRFVLPQPLRRVKSWGARMAVHALVMLLVTPPVATALLPLMHALGGRALGWLNFLIISLIFSAACLFPSVAVQELRHRARNAEHRALALRQAALEAQLAALQARTDPHFLFNSLNTVASLISEDPELAERTLERLADLFRYALESSRLRTVKLERELAMVADYLELQSARFGTRLHTSLQVERGLGELEIPPLLLQPLVENAIVHGTSRRGGRVDVAVRRELDRLVIEISDDGPGPGHSAHAGAGTAVAVVGERLRLCYAERGSLRLEAGQNGGCRARLVLPIGVGA
ncbi:MAG TPA: histidine kinase [Polyangiaceae bacterium]|nr:histidine kinase [Polyangiaceae bacterium]